MTAHPRHPLPGRLCVTNPASAPQSLGAGVGGGREGAAGGLQPCWGQPVNAHLPSGHRTGKRFSPTAGWQRKPSVHRQDWEGQGTRVPELTRCHVVSPAELFTPGRNQMQPAANGGLETPCRAPPTESTHPHPARTRDKAKHHSTCLQASASAQEGTRPGPSTVSGEANHSLVDL